MRKTSCIATIASLVFGFGVILPACAQAQELNKTGTAGKFTITLKLLPTKSFSGPNAEMVRDGGANAVEVSGPEQPNHHLAAFLTQNDQPVEKAEVAISYRESSSSPMKWTELPVVRMHEAGKSMDTTRFGNNVRLPPGGYEVQVTVNGEMSATFQITLT
jgi:type II secretory pathway component GspD/PulD (secretin)